MVKNIRLVIAKNLRKCFNCETQRLSLFKMQEIAVSLNITTLTLNNYLKGITPIKAETLYMISELYNKPVEWFFKEETNNFMKE